MFPKFLRPTRPPFSLESLPKIGSGVEKELKELSPRILIVLIGVNDLRWGVSVARFVDDYKKFIESFRPQCRVMVQSIIPVRNPEPWPGVNQRILEANQVIEGWCRETGVDFVNISSRLAPEGFILEQYSSDGVHLSGEGIKAWVSLIRQALEQ